LTLLSFDEARARLLSSAARLPAERVALAEAWGRVLAADLVAESPLPPFDYSAMDGYAVATADLEGDPPWTLPVAGESPAGGLPSPLPSRAATRIFTGGRLPERADAVVMQESVTRSGDRVGLQARPSPGQHIRRAGEDLTAGARAIEAGTRLSAGAIALAAMLDRPALTVARRPRVTILCTGDELRAPGSGPRPGSIPESNSAPLAALASQGGAVVEVAPIVPDDPKVIERAIEAALVGSDLLITVGGVSVGDRDFVRPALERAGVTLDFWKVAIKPGKPLVVGSRETTHVLGLPGNPASALVTMATFGVPLLRVLQGDARPLPMTFAVRLDRGRTRSPDRMEFVRATLHVAEGILVARAHDNQASGAATSLATSDGLARVAPGDIPIERGAFVDFLRWNDV
jgi:molybdopterin molybdotransferase